MKAPPPRQKRQRARGVALIIVLLTLFTLGAMAGIFAYAMKVEMRLASNTSYGTEMEWMARSGVELGKWLLVEQDRVTSERGFHALNQFWAGGPGPIDSADNPFGGMSLTGIELGAGRISLRIEDQERWHNINTASRSPILLDQAISMTGADASDASIITSALADWIDRDDFPRAGNGAESEYYLTLDPPYLPKNGPLDDISELLLVKGVTPEMFWGPDRQASAMGTGQSPSGRLGDRDETEAVGLADLFRALSVGRININTASEPVLRLAFNGDTALAREAIRIRAGGDGIDGTDDDQPARNPGEIARILGPAAGAGASFTVQSFTFAIYVTVELGNTQQVFRGLVRRSGARDFQVLQFRRQ